MDFVFRNFFYAVGLVSLWAMSSMNAETAQFRDFILMVQSQSVWILTATVAVMLCGLDFALSRPIAFASRSSNGVPAIQRAGDGQGKSST